MQVHKQRIQTESASIIGLAKRQAADNANRMVIFRAPLFHTSNTKQMRRSAIRSPCRELLLEMHTVSKMLSISEKHLFHIYPHTPSPFDISRYCDAYWLAYAECFKPALGVTEA